MLRDCNGCPVQLFSMVSARTHSVWSAISVGWCEIPSFTCTWMSEVVEQFGLEWTYQLFQTPTQSKATFEVRSILTSASTAKFITSLVSTKWKSLYEVFKVKPLIKQYIRK